ncbi:glycerophosphodiester phosphodiesterase [bacterium]|nr:glycerophosphodiester phosphodiesterase [bacterium]
MNFLELFKRPALIFAHRGARSVRPENTLSALEESVGRCDLIEVDVQLSRDAKAVIMHDETLHRTTNVAAMETFKSRFPYKVCDFTLKELQTLDYGSWFYISDPFHQIAQGKVNLKVLKEQKEPLLTLHDALVFVKKNKLFINIEIKDMHQNFSDQKVVSTVLQEVQKLEVQNLVLLSSFRHAYLPLCKKILPNIATAALVENTHPHAIVKYLKKLKADGYHLNDALVDAHTIKKLKKAGFFVNVYTVNNPLRQKELFNMGVNGVFSDFV